MLTPFIDSSLHRVAVYGGAQGYAAADAIHRLVKASLDALELPSDFLTPGARVVLKPNWIKEHDERHPGPGQWQHVITHPAVIEAVVRWVAPRLGRGSITVCDAPQSDSSFRKIREYCTLDRMLERCRALHPNIELSLLDLRPEEWHAVDGVTVSRARLDGDPLGSTHIRLNEASEFVGHQGEGRLYGASYDMAETNQRHTGTRHEYLLCRTPMDADVLINIPKLKTHKKVGLTCALKNLVGINASKNWLPHHTEGTPLDGGDQFPAATLKSRLEHRWMGTAKRWLKNRPVMSRTFIPLKKAARVVFGDTQKIVRSGNWQGNDTCWRMVLDLNKCLLFYDGAGRRRTRPIRYLAVVDGIVGGEGNGPMSPDPKPCGVILAGTHPVAVDCVAAVLMGFDWQKLSLLRNAFEIRELNFTSFSADQIELISNRPEWNKRLIQLDEKDVFHFRPHFGWKGAIERPALVPVTLLDRSSTTATSISR
jgi:uncharacterized protein (DUF362 family)